MAILDLFRRPAPASPRIVSPWSPNDTFETIVTQQFLGLDDGAGHAVTFESALRIPAVSRAYGITTGILGRMPWRAYNEDGELATQPEWLVNTRTGVPPRNLRAGVVGDLLMFGWAVIGFELGDDDQPIDALHIPRGMWDADHRTGDIAVVGDYIPAKYQQRLVPIQLGYGENGLIVDAFETLADSRAILSAYRDRIANPTPSTDLEVAGDRWDAWTPEERRKFRDSYVKGRQAANGAVSMRPDWVRVDHGGQLPVDLFESGRNANRLDIANHAGVPASLLEGSKQSGGSDIHYSTEAGGQVRNELWDTGLVRFADAIEARLSLDDVCAPGQSLRVDTSRYLTTPQPNHPPTSED